MYWGSEPSVEVVAEKLAGEIYYYKDWYKYWEYGMQAWFLLAGWDEKKGGQLYDIPTGGMVVRRKMSACGSGSSYIRAYLNAHFRVILSLWSLE